MDYKKYQKSSNLDYDYKGWIGMSIGRGQEKIQVKLTRCLTKIISEIIKIHEFW